jgi:hypothetical protein
VLRVVYDALEGAIGVVLGVSGRWLVGGGWKGGYEGGMGMGVVGNKGVAHM